MSIAEDREPQDDDLVTSNYIQFYRFGFQHKGPCVLVDDDEDWQPEVKRYMERTQYWPNVWLAEERGGYRNITMEEP